MKFSKKQAETLCVMQKFGNLVAFEASQDKGRIHYRIASHPALTEQALCAFWSARWITIMKLWEMGAIYAVCCLRNTTMPLEVALHE